MKFGKFFARNIDLHQEQTIVEQVSDNAVPRHYVPYKQLKQLIRRSSNNNTLSPSLSSESNSHAEAYDRFVEILDVSVAEIDTYYQTKMGEFQRKAKSLSTQQHLLATMDTRILKMLYEKYIALLHNLSALRFYATLNEVAITKICKKFDKRLLFNAMREDETAPSSLASSQLPMSVRYEKKKRQLQFCDHSAFRRFNSSVNAFSNRIETSMTKSGMSPLQYKNKIAEDTMEQLTKMIHSKPSDQKSSQSTRIISILLAPLMLVLGLLFSAHYMTMMTMLIVSVAILVLSISVLVGKFKQASSSDLQVDPNVQYINPLTVSQLLLLIPTNIISRVWGIVHSVKLPLFARKPLFMLWTVMFGVNVEEMRHPMESYETLGDFFSRPLKDNVRIIDREVETPDTFVFNSPVDGRVVSMGEVDVDETTGEATLEQIKGLSYSLNELLGKSRAELISDLKRTSTGKRKRLYQIVVYLAPGDYHRIHSPIDWKVTRRTHFPGCLLPVNPIWVKFVRGLFAMNERVVLEGDYLRTPINTEEGVNPQMQEKDKFYMVAVGALNVGSIALTFDTEVKTNHRWQLPIKNSWPGVQKKIRSMNKKICKHYLDLEDPYGVGTAYDRIYPDGINIEVGEEVAHFQLGSTVVLVFELDEEEDLYAEVAVGDKVQLGQKLFTSCRSQHSNQELS